MVNVQKIGENIDACLVKTLVFTVNPLEPVRTGFTKEAGVFTPTSDVEELWRLLDDGLFFFYEKFNNFFHCV